MNIKQVCRISDEHGIRRSYNTIKSVVVLKQYCSQESEGNGGDRDYAHISYWYTPNAGDTVLSQCVRKAIQKFMPVKGWKLIQPNSPVNASILDLLNSCRKVIVGGGGLFLPDSSVNSISGWQWPVSNDQLDEIQSPIIVFSVGYNYFRGQKNSELFQKSVIKLVDRSDFIGLRNNGSIRALYQFLPEELRSKIVYQPCSTTVLSKIYPIIEKRSDRGVVAVNIAFDREKMRYGDMKKEILSGVAKAIRRIQDRGYEIHYVCHCWNDDRFLPFLKQEGIRYKLYDFSHKFPEEVIQFYNDVDIVIGMRGHAQMIPFGLNTEIITLGTHDKMKWFLEDIDSMEWYIDLQEDIEYLDKKIYDRFLYVHEDNRDSTKIKLKEEQDKLWEITKANLRTIERI